ncbi:hypothetical protein [Hymenobacter cheonanensis]|uniref:hypothetical protein n=1 Tax=Hymenobacter sp. CA2-7 TaxID=3063993 RepID=UPI002713BE74|nr:hypothetical protein [Hymenobacter sp. CA2-7]MDO7885327.1 hypothetical protein [Hymenobacter sp. CA2-7]
MDKQARKTKIEALKMQPRLLADGRSEAIRPAAGKKFTRMEILEKLGCQDLDLVYLAGTGLVFVIDAQGQANERARNEAANELWEALVPGISQINYVAGPCVVCAAPKRS